MKHECENKLHHIGNNENLSQCFINAKDYFNINRNAEIDCACPLYGILKMNENCILIVYLCGVMMRSCKDLLFNAIIVNEMRDCASNN